MVLSKFNQKIHGIFFLLTAFLVSCSKTLFCFKTELELNGLDVVKESAQILAQTVENFPTKKIAIAIIGFIAVSQGLFFFVKGLATFICGDSYRPSDGKRAGSLYGLILCLIGIGLSAAGTFASLYCGIIAHYFFVF